jgi:hypothetical protein
MSDVRPALVDLALTKCAPGVAAYHATILDLAARGFLEVSNGPDGLRVTRPGLATAADGLAGFEQQVLSEARTRLASADGAPFAALAAACDDVKNTWKPFQEQLLEEGRRLGICRKRPWIRSMGLLFLITIPVAVLAAVVPMRIWHVGTGGAILISGLSVLAFWWLLEAMGTDMLTSGGRGPGRRVAAGAGGPGRGRAVPRRPGPGVARAVRVRDRRGRPGGTGGRRGAAAASPVGLGTAGGDAGAAQGNLVVVFPGPGGRSPRSPPTASAPAVPSPG